MHDPSYLRRTALVPRTGAKVGLAVIFTAGIVSAVALRPTKAPVIEVKQAAAATVVPFAVPAVLMIPAAEPPPPAEPMIEAPPPPRALVPMINARCITMQGDDPSCQWDDGFPAISADGTLIAIKLIPDDGGRGYPGMSIAILDAKTSRVVTSHLVLSPDEYVEADDAKAPKLDAKIEKRAKAAQRALDAKKFRSLTRIAEDLQAEHSPDEATPPGGSIRAERTGDAVRMIDNETTTVLWQRRFPVEAEYPQASHDWEGGGCYPSNTRSVNVAYDAATRTVLARASYASGPCYCGDEVKFYVTRL